MNIVMMATGEFALPAFKALVASQHQIAALVTQPDRINPRKKVHPHPLKEFALEQGIPVLQPESINTAESIRKLQSLRPDLVMVAAYGQILSPEVIEIPTSGTYNLHASLLPRHRGAAPVQYAIWKGDRKTGVTIFKIEPKLDAGPIVVKRETEILPEETGGQLHDRLALLGAEAVINAVHLIESGQATPLPQDDSLATKSPKIKKAQGEIDWNLSPREIDCHIRAMQPWPNPFSFLHREGKKTERVLILKVAPCDHSSTNNKPGSILEAQKNSLIVQTGKEPLSIELIQMAGKNVMTADEFLRGHPLGPQDYFGSETD